MSIHRLPRSKLAEFLDTVRRTHRLVAPVRDGELLTFRAVEDVGAVAPDTDYVLPRTSIKEFFFPKSEPILRFERREDGVELSDGDAVLPPTVLFGPRPCDASSLPIMDALYGWDSRDEFWFARREATCVVAVTCTRADASCFCTALDGAPHGTAGSDLLLTPVDAEQFLVEVLSEKGEAVVALAPDAFEDWSGGDPAEAREAAARPALDALPPPLDLDAITEWLKAHFESERWADWSFKCWGCGCCTFLCPTCHCFDIVDEGGYKHGQRRKNWDACQFAQFTLHASGHNPRPDQAARWRQRVEHKFNYYVQKFDLRSCVGCGRCIRHCPVDMNIHAQLREITELAAAPASPSLPPAEESEKAE